jgi:hypothetical protein
MQNIKRKKKVEKCPWPIWGWSNHPQKAKKKKVWVFEGGWATTKGLGVVSATLKSLKAVLFFLFFGLLGVAGPPPCPYGWFNQPQPRSHPLGQKCGGLVTPFWPKPPRFSTFFFF